MSDLGLHLARSRTSRNHERTDRWIRDNDRFRRDILKLLRKSGPLSSRDIPDTSVVPWASTGWTNDRNVTQMLEFLIMRGEVAIAGRVGRERLWDLPDRVYPADVVVPSVEDALRTRNERRLASLGIARKKTTAMPLEPVDVGEAGEPAVVEGVKGEWRVDPAALGGDFEGRTALLSPFDRLVYDRRRAQELFEFEYTLEMYKPAAKPLGLLRPPGASRRPAGREGRRHRRPQGLRLAGARDPRRREVHPRDDQGRRRRVGGPGRVARARVVAATRRTASSSSPR